jgi:hypothetical protein
VHAVQSAIYTTGFGYVETVDDWKMAFFVKTMRVGSNDLFIQIRRIALLLFGISVNSHPDNTANLQRHQSCG